MKKLQLIAALAVLAMNAALCGQTITVTSPAFVDEWITGNTHTITWTVTGNVTGPFAIQLRYANVTSGDPVLTIADSYIGTTPPYTYSWTIPQSVASRNYFIRVNTVNSTVIGDSKNFWIREPHCHLKLNSLSRKWGSTGTVFEMYGIFGDEQGSTYPAINSQNEEGDQDAGLIVLSWSNTKLVVKIPSHLHPGPYKVMVYCSNPCKPGYITTVGPVPQPFEIIIINRDNFKIKKVLK